MSSEELSYGSGAGRWVIAAAVLGSGIASLDATVVGIALPSIHRTFHGQFGELQWVVTGYLLTLASFILLGGALGDRYGRRKMFAIGVTWFAVSSVFCGLAQSPTQLVLARVVQGIGGALLVPASLAILQASFQPSDRARAIGAWTGFAGVTSAIGPLVGGYLISVASWRWVFLINLPLAVVVLLITARHVPESRDVELTGGIDVVGAALAVVTLSGLTAGLIEGATVRWTSPFILGSFAIAIAAGIGFIATERRSVHPMLPLALFKVRQFSAANAVTFVIYGALGGALFLLPVELQVDSGYSPLESGLALLPVTVIMLLFSARSGRLSARIGPRLQMSAGPVVVGVGLALLARATDSGNYVTDVLPAVLVFAAGLAITVAPLTATAMSAAPSSHAGVASAVNNVVARTGSLLAVAALPLLGGLAGSTNLGSSAFSLGFRHAMLTAGAMCVAGGVLAAITIRNPKTPQTAGGNTVASLHCSLDGTQLQSNPTTPR